MVVTVEAWYVIKWTEYERGWGPRHVGYSVYNTEQEANVAFNKAFEGRDGYAPDTYINPGVAFNGVRLQNVALATVCGRINYQLHLSH